MSAKLPDLIRRQKAVERVQARFDGKSFLLGRRDCIRLAAALLAAVGRTVPVIPPYKTEFMAVRRLKEHGASNIAELLDGIGLARIAPAAALIGDLLYLPGDGEAGIGACVIALGNGAGLGFYEGQVGLVRMRTLDVTAAWSLLP